MTDMERAEKYWEEKENQVLYVALKSGLDSALECKMQLEDWSFGSFLYDLFDNGDYEASDEEIKNAILEALS